MEYAPKLNKVIRRHLRKSKEVAEEDDHMKFIVMASIIVGNHVFTRGNSCTKTAPLQKRYFNGRTERLHAEINLLKRFMGMDLHGPLLVTRYSRSTGWFRMAKPCVHCQRFIEDNFKNLKVWYSGPHGEIWEL